MGEKKNFLTSRRMLRNTAQRTLVTYSLNAGPSSQQLIVQQNRTAVSLKELKTRMTTISSIKKITNSMNKLATSKLTKARKHMENHSKPFLAMNMSFLGGRGIYLNPQDPPAGEEVLLLITTDRGMCGATNSSIVRLSKRVLAENRKNANFKFVIAGSKGTTALRREYSKQFALTVGDLTKKTPSFADVEALFMNMQDHVTGCFIHAALMENTACELAARMSSMDNATTNAGKMYQSLNLLFNRTRQANITTELSEIISGAAAVMEAE